MEETRIPFWCLDFWFTVRHKNHNICCSIALNSMQLEDWSWELLLTTSCFIFRHTQKDGPLFQFLSDDSAPWCSSSNSQVDSEGMLSIQTYINGKTNIHTHKDLGSCVCWKVHVKLKITIILLNVMWSFLDLLSFAKKKSSEGPLERCSKKLIDWVLFMWCLPQQLFLTKISVDLCVYDYTILLDTQESQQNKVEIWVLKRWVLKLSNINDTTRFIINMNCDQRQW